ncbi:MAG: MBL fold metallo-hydrolase [Saccharofermentans sp.]|nr:MBL fold metallo-hydrolase [Saccharofermentans sp.]
MHNTFAVTDDIMYIGASDRRLSRFENAYPVPYGMAYNSYLVSDEKTTLFDTCDWAVGRQFIENLQYALASKKLDNIVISHMEPDHCSTLGLVLDLYPDVKIYGTAKVATLIKQFSGRDVEASFIPVKDGDTLNTGKHTFKFVTAPMVHWPEVMCTYDEAEKLLFSADAFGTFGALSGNIFSDETDFWTEEISEVRRYYANIVGKYGNNVQMLLKKASALDISMILPLHGPVLRGDIAGYISYYDKWSTYTPESDSVVIFSASIYGGIDNTCEILASELAQRGVKNIKMYDVSALHYSYLVSEAFRSKFIVFAASTQDMGLFSSMEFLMTELKAKNLSNRTVAVIENGSWAPASGKHMKESLEQMKNITVTEPFVSIRSTPTEEICEQLKELAANIASTVNS